MDPHDAGAPRPEDDPADTRPGPADEPPARADATTGTTDAQPTTDPSDVPRDPTDGRSDGDLSGGRGRQMGPGDCGPLAAGWGRGPGRGRRSRHDWHTGWPGAGPGRTRLEERQAAHWRSRRPPWWPEGEPWPPAGPPWHAVPRRFRRRFLFGALSLLAVLVAVMLGVSASWRGWDGGWGGGPGSPGGPGSGHPSQGERGPGGLLFLVGGVVVVGGAATAFAYRRISRPVGDLLGAAERVAEGDYGVAVTPDGPRELRLLTATFNDMAARLAATDEGRRRFLADVTHELRTPLAVLQTGVEAQLDGIHPRDDEHLGSLLEEIQRLGRLVDDLHTLALAEAGRIELHREPVALAALVEDAVAAHAAVARQKGAVVRAELPDDLPDVEVDPTRIRQVLDNLLSNAVRHTPAGREVVVRVEPLPETETDAQTKPGIRTEPPPDPPPRGPAGPAPGPAAPAPRIRVTVSDAGPGFPPDQLDHVFERFTRSVDSRGSGLGLSIARDLVQAHGGTISAHNHPTTHGATVTFTL